MLELAAVWLRMNASTDNWQTLLRLRARESTPGSYGDRYDYGNPRVIMLKACPTIPATNQTTRHQHRR
ncbi:hypothetical protein KCP74_20600 [Salmonella enterica subsp. enterica]|nr:hypothetical protein KCP74_20600 [Salmonella enterica subsp. enterica]